MLNLYFAVSIQPPSSSPSYSPHQGPPHFLVCASTSIPPYLHAHARTAADANHHVLVCSPPSPSVFDGLYLPTRSRFICCEGFPSLRLVNFAVLVASRTGDEKLERFILGGMARMGARTQLLIWPVFLVGLTLNSYYRYVQTCCHLTNICGF
jgi:hypothetical protein